MTADNQTAAFPLTTFPLSLFKHPTDCKLTPKGQPQIRDVKSIKLAEW
jgi:hypothetical protein